MRSSWITRAVVMNHKQNALDLLLSFQQVALPLESVIGMSVMAGLRDEVVKSRQLFTPNLSS